MNLSAESFLLFAMTDKAVPEAPPLPKRLSQAIQELPEHRESWPARLRDELTGYVATLRDCGMTPERSLVTVKQLARPLFDHSDGLSKQVVGWVLDVYFDRRGSERPKPSS